MGHIWGTSRPRTTPQTQADRKGAKALSCRTGMVCIPVLASRLGITSERAQAPPVRGARRRRVRRSSPVLSKLAGTSGPTRTIATSVRGNDSVSASTGTTGRQPSTRCPRSRRHRPSRMRQSSRPSKTTNPEPQYRPNWTVRVQGCAPAPPPGTCRAHQPLARSAPSRQPDRDQESRVCASWGVRGKAQWTVRLETTGFGCSPTVCARCLKRSGRHWSTRCVRRSRMPSAASRGTLVRRGRRSARSSSTGHAPPLRPVLVRCPPERRLVPGRR